MFGAELRYLETHVTLVDHILIHAIHLMSEHKSIAVSVLRVEILKLHTPFDLFETT